MNKLIIALIAVLSATDVHAQIPQQVTDILEKCDKVMDNPKGLEIDMKVHVGMVLITMDGTMKWYSKGDLSREIMKVKFEGKVGPATMRMTATKYKVGVDENIFKLDPAKFPDAVVVRR